jgi:pimeloyl-ACP methyl ester carboxylesterase
VSRPTTDDALGQHLDELLPLFFRDPGENLPLLQTAMAGPNSSWVSHAQGAADRLSSAEQSVASANICAQTLILVGRHDWLCPVAISEQLHAGLQRSKLVVFENAGHFPWIEEPDRFFPEVTDFLLIDA